MSQYMPKCPQCKNELYGLSYCGTHTVSATFTKDGTYESEYVENWENMVYTCPECGVKIADDEDKAMDFLNPHNKE